jgi:hypothetical protein
MMAYFGRGCVAWGETIPDRDGVFATDQEDEIIKIWRLVRKGGKGHIGLPSLQMSLD